MQLGSRRQGRWGPSAFVPEVEALRRLAGSAMWAGLMRSGLSRERRVPAEAQPRWSRLERTLRQAGGRLGQVVAGGRHVVRRIPMEQRGQVLDLATTHAQLELAAAVIADPMLGAVVKSIEQVPETAQTRGLYVHHLGGIGQAFDVSHRVDRCVPREAFSVRFECRVGLWC